MLLFPHQQILQTILPTQLEMEDLYIMSFRDVFGCAGEIFSMGYDGNGKRDDRIQLILIP